MGNDRAKRLNKAFNYLRFKGVIGTQKDVAVAMNSTQPNVSSALKGDEKILTDSFIYRFSEVFKEVSSHWLLTGEGEMLLKEKEDKPKQTSYNSQEGIPLVPDFAMAVSLLGLKSGKGEMPLDVKEGKPKRISSNSQEGIPLIPDYAMACGHLGFQDIDPSELTYFNIPTFRGAEFLISVRGDSMIPKYFSGDLLACKQVPLNGIFFQWGQTYVLDTAQGALIKRVEQADEEGSILLMSENPQYKPLSIPIAAICHVAIIVGLIRLE